MLKKEGISVLAYTLELGGVRAQKRELDAVGKNMFYCPDMDVVSDMEKQILEVKKAGDSLGGIVDANYVEKRVRQHSAMG